MLWSQGLANRIKLRENSPVLDHGTGERFCAFCTKIGRSLTYVATGILIYWSISAILFQKKSFTPKIVETSHCAEKPARAHVPGPPIIPHLLDFVNRQNTQKIKRKAEGVPSAFLSPAFCETSPRIGRLPPSGFSSDSSEKLPMGWGR